SPCPRGRAWASLSTKTSWPNTAARNPLPAHPLQEKNMLFKVEMKVNLPHDMPAEVAAEIKAREKAYAQELQAQGKWRHLWRVAGSYANVSIFDVADNAELQELISALPLF